MGGWRPDRPDWRDQSVAFSWPWQSPPLPRSVDMRPLCPRIEDQGDIGSCSAHATTSAMEFLYRKLGKPQPELSRLFTYYATRVWVEGAPPTEDSGCTMRDVVKAMAKFGTCPESMLPYDTSRFADAPPPACVAEAKQHTITKYLRCPTTDAIKRTLAGGFPVVIGFSVPESAMSDEVAQTGEIPLPAHGEAFVGGHAIYLCGYDESQKVFIFGNSWGTGWGAKGFGFLPYQYVAMGLATDAWTIQAEVMEN